ncbi:MAG: hypothetical protein Q9162_000309 [Coniocarpon cinnabarinum]
MRVGSTGNNTSHNPGVIGNRPNQPTYISGAQRAQNHVYMNPNAMMSNSNNTEEADDIVRSLKGISLQTPSVTQSGQPSPLLSTQGSTPSGVALPYMYNGQLMFSQQPYYTQNGAHALNVAPGMYGGGNNSMMNGSVLNAYQQSHFTSEHSPPSWQSSRMTSGQVPPSLVTPRRSSGGSSNEHDIPGTPFTQYTGVGGGVPVFDHSPNSIYAWSTPSPTQARFFNKPQAQIQIPLELQVLCQKDPPIPKAVPAPFSPTKPLDRRLENPNGITNVYIRGLQPNTSDEMLYSLAKRFGDIESSKAIIDLNTGLCKGFGFVKYFNFKDAEDCIRGFHFCGYETSFARESFYSQLKKLADQAATNLYISNLPIEFNEHDLGAIFDGYEVCSKRILRTADGSGRGVGFARFASHEVCEQVIQDFNNRAVSKADGEKYNIQIRYADTPEQKALKQQTTAARQYRSAEYESQTSQTPDSAFVPHINGANDFEQYISGALNGHAPSDAYDTGVGVNGRLSALSSHLSPSLPSATVNVHVPQNGRKGMSEDEGSAGDDEKTIHAAIVPASTKEKPIYMDTRATA